MNISKDKKHLDVVDYLTSNESFELHHNLKYDMLVTDAPTQVDISRYYDSPDYISHTDSKRSLIDIAYQFVKENSLKRKVALISKFGEHSGQLLDIGAGTGDFLAAVKAKNWSVSGVEPNRNARNLASTKSINLVDNISDVVQEQFNVITMWHVLEHIYDLDEMLAFLKSRLATDGVLFVAVPNFKSFDAHYYGKFWAAYDVPRHLWHFSQNAISELFSEYNMNVVDTLPMIFDSFYISLLSEKYLNGKTNYLKSFLTGLKSNRLAKKSGQYSSLIYVIKHK